VLTPTNEQLEEIGIEDTGISIPDELKKYRYLKLKKIRDKLMGMLTPTQAAELEKESPDLLKRAGYTVKAE